MEQSQTANVDLVFCHGKSFEWLLLRVPSHPNAFGFKVKVGRVDCDKTHRISFFYLKDIYHDKKVNLKQSCITSIKNLPWKYLLLWFASWKIVLQKLCSQFFKTCNNWIAVIAVRYCSTFRLFFELPVGTWKVTVCPVSIENDHNLRWSSAQASAMRNKMLSECDHWEWPESRLEKLKC